MQHHLANDIAFVTTSSGLVRWMQISGSWQMKHREACAAVAWCFVLENAINRVQQLSRHRNQSVKPSFAGAN
jgi:hypothetical protein